MDWKIKESGPSWWPQLLFLSLFFLLGTILGQVLAGRVPAEAGQELAEYLRRYAALETECSPRVILSALVLYFRYPLAALLLGFASIGVALLPGITAAFGFFLSFSICCFTASFGEDGILLALAVSGLRCAVTLPCYLLLAVPSWRTSAALAASSFGRGRRVGRVVYGPEWWRRAAVCGAVLLAGMILDLYCSPWLLQRALERMASQI